MFKRWFLLIALIGLGMAGNAKAGIDALGTNVVKWPTFYPGGSLLEAYMIVVPGGIPGINETLYVNGGGSFVKSSVEFLGHYAPNGWAKITAWDWARNKSATVIGTDGNIYTCKRDHISSLSNKPVTGANWNQYWELRGTAGGTWESPRLYLDREGDGNNSRHLYNITANGLTSITQYGYTPPSGNFMKTNHVIPGYGTETFKVIRFRNAARYFGIDSITGREKWRNEVALYDFSTLQWVSVYQYDYQSDVDFNKARNSYGVEEQGGHQPWIEPQSDTLTMTSPGPKVGFDDCKIIIHEAPPWYMLIPTDPAGGTFTTFYNNRQANWPVDFKTPNYAWVVHYQQ